MSTHDTNTHAESGQRQTLGVRPPSEYQIDCKKYYRLLRKAHSSIYSAPERRAAELHEHRYVAEEPPQLLHVKPLNLNTIIEVLHRMVGDGPAIQVIDYGCGSHWFVDYVRSAFGWSAVGYDPDPVAIQIAKATFPQNAEFYRLHDPLYNRLPAQESSQTIVFCNAVFQHFDDEECKLAIKEMARVLRRGGYCLQIFKRWTEELANGTDPIQESIRVLDADSGKLLFDDPSMRKAIAKLHAGHLADLDKGPHQGLRLLHFLRDERILAWAEQSQLEVAQEVLIDQHHNVAGVLKYRSGKGTPTACILLVRD